MLTVTNRAASAIRSLTRGHTTPAGAGLRIAVDPSAGRLRLSVASAPQDGDAVVDTAGARVFLDRNSAKLLNDKALDAAADDEGEPQFAIITTQ